ncbi:hypothetical protein D3C75_1109920 [compost metagenome]
MLSHIDLLPRHELNTVFGCRSVVHVYGTAHQRHPHPILKMTDTEQRAQHVDLRDTGIDAERAYKGFGHIEQRLPGLQFHTP